MKAVVRPLALLTAAASLLAVAATAYWSQRWNFVTIAMLVALTWSAILATIDAFSGRRRAPLDPVDANRAVPVTYVMRLGEERLDIARTSLLLAAQAGPVVVVATRHHEVLDDLGPVDVREYVAPTIAAALHEATRTISTEAVLILSASAFPLGRRVRARGRATGRRRRLGDRQRAAFNNDRYTPGERELIATRVRAAGRAHGLESWEPDATIVRTSILREHPLEPGRPDGAWLRDRAAEGWHGANWSEPVAVRAAPADAPVFWPTQTKRRRGAVADLADAMTRGPARARAAAAGWLAARALRVSDGVVAAGDRGDRPIGSVPAVRSRRRLLRVASRARSHSMDGEPPQLRSRSASRRRSPRDRVRRAGVAPGASLRGDPYASAPFASTFPTSRCCGWRWS